MIKEESNLNLDWRKRIVFEARLMPLSLSRYRVYVDFKEAPKEEKAPVLRFESGRKQVEIDAKTGLLSSYRIEGVEYLGEGFGLCLFDDNADPWAMGSAQRERVGTNERPFSLSKKPSGVFAGMKSVQTIEDGDIYLGVESFFECENTRARILYKIYKNTDDVDIDVTLYPGDIDKMIKLKLPVARHGDLIGQTAFGTQLLFTDARENVAHRFVAVDTGERCLALLNRDVYGSHYENGSLYMSLIRGVTYCAHPINERTLIPKDRFTKKIDQGESTCSFRLTVASRQHLERKAAEFVQKPYALNIFPIPSKECKAQELRILLGDDIISVPTVKKAKGDQAVIFRCLNNTPDAVDTYIQVNEQVLPLRFGRYEVKTVVYEGDKLWESYELLI